MPRRAKLASRWTVGAGLVLAALPAPARAQAIDPTGQTVLEIAVASDFPALAASAREAVVLRVGEPYTIDAARESLQNIWALGDVANVSIDATQRPDGVGLRFSVEVQPRLWAVEFLGVTPVSESRLRRALSIREGQALTPAGAALQAERIQQTLADDGYLLARVTATVRRREPPTRGILSFQIDPGERTRLESLTVVGDPGITSGQVVATLGLSAGEPYRPSRLEAGLAQLRRSLVDHHFFFAEIRVAEQSLDLSNNSMRVVVGVEAGPAVELQVSGFPGVGQPLREALTIYEFASVDDWALKESRHRLVLALQSRGYWRPLVSYSRQRDSSGRNVDIAFRILAGRRARLARIEFVGNASIPTAELRVVIRSETSRFLDPNRFIGEWWQDDQRAVVTAYRRRGFRDARVVDAPVRLDDDGGVVAIMIVEEGARTLVEGVQLEVLSSDPTPGITAPGWATSLELQPGGPFDSSAMGRDTDRLRALLANVGYPRGIVTSTITIGESGPIVSYRIDPGARARVGRLLIAGNDTTARDVIARELAFVPGSPFSFSDVLSSQSRLYSLGIFSEVDIESTSPDELGESRAVVVRVREAAPMFVSYGAGFDTEEKARGLLTFGHNNLFGRNVQGSFSVRASLREQRVRVLVRDPWFLGRRLEASAAGFYTSEQEPSFDVQRVGGSIQLVTHERGRVAGIARYSFRDVNAFNIKIDPDLIKRQDQSTRVGSLGYTLVSDTRSGPAEPTSGSYRTIDVELASRAFGSNTDFVTVFGRSFWYRDIGRGVVAAIGLRAGAKIPYRSTTDVPLPERFFAGGSTSLRGFALDQAGPTDRNGNPLGGEAVLIGNMEIRVPVRHPFGVVAFVDVGNVFAKPSSIAWGRLREMAGLGIRYGTPVGPIRLDLARLLDRRPGESLFQIFFSVGHTF